MQPAGLHETRLFEFSDETSGFKIDSFNPKCNQHWRSQFLSEWFHATKLVAFRIEGVNFDSAGGVTVTQLFFWLMVGPWDERTKSPTPLALSTIGIRNEDWAGDS